MEDSISFAAKSQLEHTQKRSALTWNIFQPDDSASLISPRVRTRKSATAFDVGHDTMSGNVPQTIRVHHVTHDQWRNLKSRIGILPYLPTLLVSTAPLDESNGSNERDEARINDGSPVIEQGESLSMTSKREPTRLALNSTVLLAFLHDTTGARLTKEKNVLVYPFPLLILNQSKIRSKYDELCARVADNDGQSL